MRTHIRLLLIVVLLHSHIPASAQVIDVKVCDSAIRLPITRYTQYLQTTTPIGVDSAVRLTGRFKQAANEPVLAFNYDPFYYWFKVTVNNTVNHTRTLMLVMAPFGLYDGKLYQPINGRYQEVAHTGLKYRFADRSYQFTHHVFPFTLPAHTTDTLLVSIDARNVNKTFGFALLQPRELKLYENKIYFVFGIIIGLLLLFFVLNISLFFALREKLHGWYALYIFLLFLVVMKNDMLDQQLLGLDTELAFRLTPYMSIGAFAIALLTHVTQIFLKPVLHANRILYNVTTVLKINVLISALVHAVVFFAASNFKLHAVVFSWAKISTLLCILSTIGNCLYCVRKGLRSAWFILCGSLVFMIGSVQRLFFPSTLSFLFPPTTFHIGIIVETFVISIALMYRFWYEKELQKEREDQIQILTSNDISEEIHDYVLQNLAVANQYLYTIDFEDNKAIVTNVNKAQEKVSAMIKHLRYFSRNLKNEPEGTIDLIEDIRKLCEETMESNKILVRHEIEGVPMVLVSRKQAIIIRIITGIFNNITSHANASAIDVSLKFTHDMLIMDIRDDGVGFDINKEVMNSNGIKNILNRCVLLNATCQFESAKNKGTRILFRMPYEY